MLVVYLVTDAYMEAISTLNRACIWSSRRDIGLHWAIVDLG
jgi:hypothetical protein